MGAGVRIIDADLRKFRADLRRLGVHKDLQKANKKAAQPPADKAKQYARKSFGNLAGGVTRPGSAVVASIRPLATQTKAYVAGGKATVPYYGGMDFGSGGAHRQFGPKLSEGRFIYPAIADTAPKIIEVYVNELDGLISRAFPDGRL